MEINEYYLRVVKKSIPSSTQTPKILLRDWMNQWYRFLIKTHTNGFFDGHKTRNVFNTLFAHDIKLSSVLDDSTGLVQPLHISINR